MTINTEFGKITASRETIRRLWCELNLTHGVTIPDTELGRFEYSLLEELSRKEN